MKRYYGIITLGSFVCFSFLVWLLHMDYIPLMLIGNLHWQGLIIYVVILIA